MTAMEKIALRKKWYELNPKKAEPRGNSRRGRR